MKNNNTESQSNRQIVFGGMISYGIIGLNILLGLIYTPWILRTVGSSQYGLYTLASSLIALFLQDFGMSAAVTRFIAVYRAKDDNLGINQVFTIVVKLYFGIMVVVAIILFFVFLNLTTIYSNLEPAELETFKGVFAITSFCVVICFPVNVCNGVLNAYEEFIALKLSDVINRLGTVLVTFIALSANGGIYALIIISGVINIITFIVKLVIMHRRTSVQFIPRYFDGTKLKEIATFSVWSTVSSIAQQMIFNIMPTILAMTLNTAAITMYGFANVIEGYVSTITGAINGLFLPKISRVVKDDKDASGILPLMIRVGRINQSIVSLLFMGVLFTGEKFIGLWLGSEYTDVYYCMVMLIVPYCISSSLQIASSSVIAMNQIHYSAIINICTGVFNLISAYLLAPRFGVIGVCACISATYILRTLFNLVVYVEVLHINLGKFFINCHIKMIPGLFLSAGVSYFIIRFGIGHITHSLGWIGFLMDACTVSIVYVVIMWFFGWNDGEKNMFYSLMKRRKA